MKVGRHLAKVKAALAAADKERECRAGRERDAADLAFALCRSCWRNRSPTSRRSSPAGNAPRNDLQPPALSRWARAAPPWLSCCATCCPAARSMLPPAPTAQPMPASPRPRQGRAVRCSPPDRRPVRQRHPDPRVAPRLGDKTTSRPPWPWPRMALPSCRSWAAIMAPTIWRGPSRPRSGSRLVTTAGDNRFGLALDAPPPGWTLANPEHAKQVMARLLEGERVRLAATAGDLGWLRGSDLPTSAKARLNCWSPLRRRRARPCAWSTIRPCWRWASAPRRAPRPKARAACRGILAELAASQRRLRGLA